MAKLITHLDEELLAIYLGYDYNDIPSKEEILEYLRNTDDDEPSEEVMGNFIIQFIDEEEGIMFDFC